MCLFVELLPAQERCNANLAAVESFVNSHKGFNMLAESADIRSNTSVCLTLDLNKKQLAYVPLRQRAGCAGVPGRIVAHVYLHHLPARLTRSLRRPVPLPRDCGHLQRLQDAAGGGARGVRYRQLPGRARGPAGVVWPHSEHARRARVDALVQLGVRPRDLGMSGRMLLPGAA